MRLDTFEMPRSSFETLLECCKALDALLSSSKTHRDSCEMSLDDSLEMLLDTFEAPLDSRIFSIFPRDNS